MRCFENIAKLIRTKRLSHEKGYSQSELSHLLGYKNGQFISNVERALCNIPLKMLGRVSEVLNIPSEELKQSILRDQERTLDNYLKLGSKAMDLPDEDEDGVTIPGRKEFDKSGNGPMVEGQFKAFF